jgi:hypothetical protein
VPHKKVVDKKLANNENMKRTTSPTPHAQGNK